MPCVLHCFLLFIVLEMATFLLTYHKEHFFAFNIFQMIPIIDIILRTVDNKSSKHDVMGHQLLEANLPILK